VEIDGQGCVAGKHPYALADLRRWAARHESQVLFIDDPDLAALIVESGIATLGADGLEAGV